MNAELLEDIVPETIQKSEHITKLYSFISCCIIAIIVIPWLIGVAQILIWIF